MMISRKSLWLPVDRVLCCTAIQKVWRIPSSCRNGEPVFCNNEWIIITELQVLLYGRIDLIWILPTIIYSNLQYFTSLNVLIIKLFRKLSRELLSVVVRGGLSTLVLRRGAFVQRPGREQWSVISCRGHCLRLWYVHSIWLDITLFEKQKMYQTDRNV
jgi:hypothetical protein